MKKGQKKRIWTKEQKIEIIEKHLKEHVSVRTIEKEYLLPGDLISFSSNSATNQYLYLGDITIDSVKYENALLVFTTTAGVKLVYGSDADALLDKFIGYNRFAIIRPSLYF